jgi:hypothetical protein
MVTEIEKLEIGMDKNHVNMEQKEKTPQERRLAARTEPDLNRKAYVF